MSKESQLRQVLDGGIVAVVRSPDSQQLVDVARALADGGVTVVEITLSVPNALEVIRQVRQALGDRLLLGAGTVLDAETGDAVPILPAVKGALYGLRMLWESIYHESAKKELP